MRYPFQVMEIRHVKPRPRPGNNEIRIRAELAANYVAGFQLAARMKPIPSTDVLLCSNSRVEQTTSAGGSTIPVEGGPEAVKSNQNRRTDRASSVILAL